MPADAPIIDVRAIPFEAKGPAHSADPIPGNKTDRGREMFPDVSEVPPEYSSLFQDYDSTGPIGVDPIWLDENEGEAEPKFKLPTLMIGGVVLATFASGMGLAQLHNIQRQNAAKEESKPSTGAPTKATGTTAQTSQQAGAKVGAKVGAKAAVLASPEALRPDWLSKSGTKTQSTNFASAMVPAKTNGPTAKSAVQTPLVQQLQSNSLVSRQSSLPLASLPPAPKSNQSLASLRPLTAGISASPLSRTMMMTPRIFPARLSVKQPPSTFITASRPVIRPTAGATTATKTNPTGPDRFSSVASSVTANSAAEPMQLRSIDEVMAERMSQSAANLSRRRQRAASQPGAVVVLSSNPRSGNSASGNSASGNSASGLDRNGRSFGYESLAAKSTTKAAIQTAPLPTKATQAGSETAQWQPTNPVITTTGASSGILVSPGLPSISLPALSISIQESLTGDSLSGNELTNPPANGPSLSKDALPDGLPEPKASVTEPSPQANLPRSMDLASMDLAMNLASAQLDAQPLDSMSPPSLASTISSPQYSGIEYSDAN